MTASLPVPHEPASDEDEILARHGQRGPRALPRPPKDAVDHTAAPPTPTSVGETGGADASAGAEPAPEPAVQKRPAAPRTQKPAPPRKPRAPRTTPPRKRTTKTAPTTDPGPPPPLPDDLETVVVPPVPPLPPLDTVALTESLPSEIVVPPKPPLPPIVVGDAQVGADREAPEADSSTVRADADPATVEPEDDETTVDAEADDTTVETKADDTVVDAEADETTTQREADSAEELFAELVGTPEPRTALSDALAAPVDAPPSAADDPPERPAAVVGTSVLDADLPATSVDATTAALAVQGVTKAFGDTRAVDGIDLVVPPGIFYGLVGPNGAGKTTTLSMIAGLLRPDRGSITVGGVDAAAQPRAAKKLMGVLPDRLRTFDRLTGRQLLYYAGVLRGLAPAVVESRAADLARAFDLSDALGRPVSDYSAGMTKKVMLAGAMIHSPRLLVLDEPFESVDPVSSAAILDILDAYVSHGGTVILSSHGMDLVERVCSRVAVMVAGQILAEGTIDEVRGELTLEQRFVELAGGLSDVEGLEWLHTFSG